MAGLLHDPGFRFTDDNGNILAGGKVYTYVAGTTTNKATYKEQAESNAHTNPIILDADGTAPGGTGIWLLTDELYKIRIDDANDNTIATFDNVAAAGGTLTSGVTLGGNLDVNGYKIVSNSDGNIDIDPNGVGVTNIYAPTLQDNLLTNNNNIAINDDKGIVETSSLNELLYFTGVTSAVNYLQISNSATSNAPIIEAKGDDANVGITLTPKGTGQVTIDNLTFPAADGTAGQIVSTDGAGNLNFIDNTRVLLETQTISAGASITFTSNIDSTYDTYEIRLEGLVPSTDAVTLDLTVSTDGGSTYKTGASDYVWMGDAYTTAGTLDAADSRLPLSYTASGYEVGNDAGNSINGVVRIYNAASSSLKTQVTSDVVYQGATVAHVTFRMGGRYDATTAVNALKLAFTSGTGTGTAKLYGIT